MRADLLALGPDALAKLANVGLLKRAVAEVAAGRGPAVAEEPDGTVVGRSPDGAVVRVPKGGHLGTCTCGAASCRHRLATLLVYQQENAAPAAPEPWDPGAFTDEDLAQVCGADAVSRARKALGGTYLAELVAGPSPSARLPGSSVSFLAPRDLGFAKCDCVRGGRCEHVVAAVWAFRRAPEGGVVELGAGASTADAALDAAEAAVVEVLTRGIANLADPRAIVDARVAAEAAGAAWLALALADLERHHEAYVQQSARFDVRHGPLWVAEIASRVRAARHAGPLPAAFVLGANEARETWLETTRWVGLGAQLDADGGRRSAEVWLADPDAGEVWLARREFTFEGEAPNGAALGQRFVSSRMSVAALVGAEVIAKGARRHADGRCDLGTARSMKATPFRGAPRWGELPESIRVDDLDAYAQRPVPPRFLAPRRVGARVRVVSIGAVDAVAWSPAEQEATVFARDLAGHPLLLRAPWRAVAPGAPSALVRVAPELKWAAGELRRRAGRWEMTPCGLATADAVIAPDLAEEAPMAALPVLAAEGDPLGDGLRELQSAVERAVHIGFRAVAAEPLAETLAGRGFTNLARWAARARSAPTFVDLVVAAGWAHLG